MVAAKPLTRKQQAALGALRREGQAYIVAASSAYLDSSDPEVNVQTANALTALGLARWERQGLEDWVLVPKEVAS